MAGGDRADGRARTLQEQTVDDLEMISDGNGLAVIGSPGSVDCLLTSQGLPSQELGLPRLGNVLSRGAGTAQTASEMALIPGRWVRLTKDSAELASKFETGAAGIGAARRGGSEAHVRARSMTRTLSDELAEPTARRRADRVDTVGL
jgi:hypothetical protein